MMILPLADALQNCFQNLTSRIAGVDNEQMTNRVIGMGAMLGFGVGAIKEQFNSPQAKSQNGENTSGGFKGFVDRAKQVINPTINLSSEKDYNGNVNPIRTVVNREKTSTNNVATSTQKVNTNNQQNNTGFTPKTTVGKVANAGFKGAKAYLGMGAKLAEGDFSKSIKETIAKEPEVKGVYDLIINNYGPDRYMASAHIEIPDTMTAGEIDELTRKIQENVYRKHAVIMAAIGIYSVNTNNDVITKIHERIRQLSMSEDGVLQMHGFFVDTEDKRINFDLVIDFDVENRSGLIEVIKKKVEKEFPDYKIHITLDNDFSD